MSQIFDALQRAEGNRPEDAGLDDVKATDVLKRVEDRLNLRDVALAGKAAQVSDRNGSVPEGNFARHERRPRLVTMRADAEPSPEVFERFPELEGEPSPASKLVSLTQRESATAEAFSLLAVRLNDFKQGRQMKRVLVTSSIPQEGKSLVAANLACALSESDHSRVLLVEGDMRRPSLCALFEVPTGNGITEFLEDKCALEESIFFIRSAGVWLLPAGKTSANPQELMKSERLASLVAQISTWFDWVVIDSPPMLPLADTSIWMRIADGILLTARKGKTEKKALKSCIEALDQEKLIGAILNSAKPAEHSDYYCQPREPEST
jgi:capsular exopolysaccharide synthesis family protein